MEGSWVCNEPGVIFLAFLALEMLDKLGKLCKNDEIFDTLIR